MNASARIRQIPPEKLVIFFGAGMSRGAPACLPLGRELLRKTLHLLDSEAKHRHEIETSLLARPTSLERIFASMNEAFGYRISRLYQCIDNRRISAHPSFNACHLWITELARRGAILVTTNQDLLIEEAAMARSIYLHRVIHHQDIAKHWNYLKLHGSVDIPRSLAVVLERTSVLSKWKTAILKHLAQDHYFLFCGYGGWDLDILPFIASLPPERAIWYEFSGMPSSSHILRIFSNSALDDWLIQGNGSDDYLFVDLLGLPVRNSCIAGGDSMAWSRKLERLVREMTDEYQKRVALAAGLNTSWNGAGALAVLQEAFGYCGDDWRRRYALHLGMAKAFARVGKDQQQFVEIRNAAVMLRRHHADPNFLLFQCQLLLQMIEFHHCKDTDKQIAKAYALLRKAHTVFGQMAKALRGSKASLRCQQLLLFYDGEVGLKYALIKIDRNIMDVSRRALERLMVDYQADLELLTDAAIILAKVLFFLGKTEDALRTAKYGLNLAERIFKPHAINHASKVIARIHIKRHEELEARRYLEHAYAVSHDECSDPLLRMRDYLSMYLFYKKFDHSADAAAYLEKARNIWVQNFDGDPSKIDTLFQEHIIKLEKLYH